VGHISKQKKEIPQPMIVELESWIAEQRGGHIDSAEFRLVARAINAVNLVYLIQGELDVIDSNMADLLETIMPNAAPSVCRSHIEGNAYFQRSILARRRSDREGEVHFLLRAMNLDCHFATGYYKLAQVLHDKGDSQAALFYEMALVLSPFDQPAANDYGCFLLDSNQQEKFESWSTVCRALYPQCFQGVAQ
jgi:hypothetical protein